MWLYTTVKENKYLEYKNRKENNCIDTSSDKIRKLRMR